MRGFVDPRKTRRPQACALQNVIEFNKQGKREGQRERARTEIYTRNLRVRIIDVSPLVILMGSSCSVCVIAKHARLLARYRRVNGIFMHITKLHYNVD